MRKHGEPIESWPLRNAINPNITYSLSFAEFEACTAAGLDLWSWEVGTYPTEFKARVLAWHSLHHQVEAHVEQARIDKAEREARKARAKRGR